MLKRLALNTGANYLFRFFSMGLGLVSVPVIVQATSEEGYGLILLISTVMGYFNMLNAGVPAGTVKYVAEYEAQDDYETVSEIINSSFFLFLGIGVLVAAGLYVFAQVDGLSLFNISEAGQGNATDLLYTASVVALLTWPASILSQSLMGLQRYVENNFFRGIGEVAGYGAAIGAALLGYSIEVIFIFLNAGVLISAVFQYSALKKFLPGWRLQASHFSTRVLKMIFGYSVWMLLKDVAVRLVYQTDRIILGLFLPVSSLTVYHVVTRPFNVNRKMASLFSSAVTPAVSAVEAAQNRAGLDQFIYTLSKYLNLFLAPLAIVGTLLSGPFILLWMGNDYASYLWIAQVACLSQILLHSNSALGKVFYGSGQVKEITLIAFTTAVVNVFLGIWWVQEIGVAGVVFSTIAASALATPLQYLWAMPKLDIDRRRYFWRSVVRGQGTSWFIGLLLIPLWSYLQSIDSWIGLLIHAATLALLFYGTTWFTTVEIRHRQKVYQFLSLS